VHDGSATRAFHVSPNPFSAALARIPVNAERRAIEHRFRWIKCGDAAPERKSRLMNVKFMRRMIVTCSVALVGTAVPVLAQQSADAAKANSAVVERDGQHDFDFEVGNWKIHLKKLMHPLTGSTEWVEFDGTSVTQKLWEGRSQIEQFETDSPMGHIEGMTLRIYNPKSHQWNLYWANSKVGYIDGPPQIGEFKDGRGEFYAQDMLDGRSVFIRFLWTKTNTDSPHFEQAFSTDGGNTWETNWITDQTRIPEKAK
jgi:hypothetical protein